MSNIKCNDGRVFDMDGMQDVMEALAALDDKLTTINSTIAGLSTQIGNVHTDTSKIAGYLENTQTNLQGIESAIRERGA